MRKTLLYGALLTLTLGTGAGAAVAATSGGTASSPAASTQQLSQQIQTLESRAAAANNAQLATALHGMDAAVQANRTADCPPNSQAGRHGQEGPPCGVDHYGFLPFCPPGSDNAGNPPPCSSNGKGNGPGGGGNGGGGGGETPAACGPADQGGTAPTGPLTGPVYGIGVQITEGGGAPLGDAVQQIACAVNGLTGL